MSRLYLLLFAAVASVYGQVEQPACIMGEIDLVFIIDASNSIGSGNFRELKSFLDDFTSHSSVDDGAVRVAAVSFSTNVEVEFFLNTYNTSEDIRNHFKKELDYLAGATNTAGALDQAYNRVFKEKNGDRENVDNFIVIITDGKSNINSSSTIPAAKQLKNNGVYIFGIGIGREVENDPAEIRGIVSEPADDYTMMLKDYESLTKLEEMIFKKICPIIEEVSVIREGSPCNEEGEVAEKRCRTFKCTDGKWRRIGYKGCTVRGRCIKWDEEKIFECNKFKCSKAGNCIGDTCTDYDYSLVNSGCMVDGECMDENKIVEDDKTCTRRKCVRREVDNEIYGEYVMVDKECVGPDGVCRPIGYTYEEHCVTYQCTASEFNGIMDASFIPVKTACKYNDDCVPLGESVTEVCDQLVCSYDDASMGYDMMLVSQGCEYNGMCLKNNEKVLNESTCTNFVCAFSKKQNRLVVKERIAGCKGDEGCTAKGATVGQGCIKYECDNNGNLKLIEAGCEVDGQCYPVGGSWRLEGECAMYGCLMAESSGDMVETYIEKNLECHDYDGNCLKPGQSFVDHCMTLQCRADGKLERVDAKCEFNGNCYGIGDELIDKKRCKHVYCKADDALGAVVQLRKYGCKDENRNCFSPGDYYILPNSCVKNRCYDDGVFRMEECQYKDKCYEFGDVWTDLVDCVQVSCDQDEYSGEPYISAVPYGCIEEGECKAPGDTYIKDCQTYECMPNGQGFQIIDSKCPWKQNCKNLNQTWFDKKTCRRYGCFADEDGDVDIVETTYGCRDADDKCFNDRKDLVQDQCITYDCDNGNLVPTKIGCETEDGCMQLDEIRIDDEKCIKYKCIMSESGDGFISTRIKEVRGCLDHDKCYFPGAKKVEDCSTFVCTRNGTFRLDDPQCEFQGQCIPLGKQWKNDEKCKKFKCVISKKTGLPVVRSFVWGCRGKNKCHKFGAKRRLRKCVVNECQRTPIGPKFVPIKLGCPKGRSCKPLDSTWVNKELCVKETCGYEEGSKFPEIFASPYGCFDESGKCYPYGAVIKDKDNDCIKYECTAYGTFTPISSGCPWKDKCRKAGTVWRDRTTCTKYRCKAEVISPTKVIMHTIQTPGCKDLNGKCLNDGDTKRYDCTDYQCDPSRGGLVIIAEACKNGKNCEPLNSTWMDPSSCITYQCLYDATQNDLFITEKQYGCQDEGGQCFNKGQRKQSECNKFVCNAKGNFQVTKAGCEKDKKCYDIDESWQEGCVTFTCALLDKGPNYVETKILEYHGCVGIDGLCYKIGEAFKDGCIEYICEKGGDFRMVNFGCVGFDGGCVMPGETVMDDCTKYQCEPYSLAMQPINPACNDNGKCRSIDEKWFDKDDCLGYKCAYNPETNDVDIVERISGCQVGGKCLKTGSRISGEDCVEFMCKNGEMIPTKIGCEYKGKCLKVNEIVEEGCSWKKCIIAEQGPTFIDTKLVTEHGCWDCYHNCHRVGEEFVHGCKITECLPGGFTNTIMHKCMTPDGYCIAFGEKYEYSRNGVTKTFTCSEIGDLEPITIEHRCRFGGSSFGDGEMITSDCNDYRCVATAAGAQFVKQKKRCMTEEGKCYAVGETWMEEEQLMKCINVKGTLILKKIGV